MHFSCPGSQPITQNHNDHNDLLVNIPLLPSQGFSGGLVRVRLRSDEWNVVDPIIQGME